MHQGITAGPPVSTANFRQTSAVNLLILQTSYRLKRFSSYSPVTEFWLVSTLVLLKREGQRAKMAATAFVSSPTAYVSVLTVRSDSSAPNCSVDPAGCT